MMPRRGSSDLPTSRRPHGHPTGLGGHPCLLERVGGAFAVALRRGGPQLVTSNPEPAQADLAPAASGMDDQLAKLQQLGQA
jgi:hypothetical protein